MILDHVFSHPDKEQSIEMEEQDNAKLDMRSNYLSFGSDSLRLITFTAILAFRQQISDRRLSRGDHKKQHDKLICHLPLRGLIGCVNVLLRGHV